MCVKVKYQDAEGSHDLLLLREKADAPTVLKGHLKSNPKTKAVIILADADNDGDTVSITLSKIKKDILTILKQLVKQNMNKHMKDI